MKVYSAKILLGGSRDNEVRRDDLTAPEVLILKSMHGQEHVTEVKLVGETDRTDRQERVRLLGDGGEVPPLYKEGSVRQVFPSDLTPFPKELPPDMIDVAGMTGDLKKATGKPVEDMTDEEMEAEFNKLDAMHKRMAKARAARGAKKGSAAQATLD